MSQNPETIIETVRKMTSRQISAIIVIVCTCVSFVLWVENRYANLQETTNNIKSLSTQIIQLQSQILSVVNSLPADQRKEVVDRASISNAFSTSPNHERQPVRH